MNRKMWIGALSASLLLGGSVAAAGNVSGQSMPSTMDAPSSSAMLQMQDYITAEQAKAVALHVAAGQIHEIELEVENGQIFYEIEIEQANGFVEVHVDALNGNVLAVLDIMPDNDLEEDDADDIDDLDDPQKHIPAETKVTPEHASEIAAKEVKGGTVVKVELDEDDIPLTYEVELKLNRGEAEVNVDASSGKVLSVKQDHDDDDDDDDHEDDHDDDEDSEDDD